MFFNGNDQWNVVKEETVEACLHAGCKRQMRLLLSLLSAFEKFVKSDY